LPHESVAVFIDYENIRRGLWRHFQKRVPEDISIELLLNTIKEVSDSIGTLYEGHVFGDWTLRRTDAREIENVPHFRAQLVLRSDSKKDRTDPVMNFAIDDFFREKPTINNMVICAGDADYCEVVRRGSRLHKNIYINYIPPGLGYGEEFEQKSMTLNFAEQLGLLEFDKVPHPQSGQPVRIVRLNRGNDMVKAILVTKPSE